MKEPISIKPVRSVVILHGYAETPQWIWYPWLKKNFLDAGITVSAPKMPNPLIPDCQRWIEALRQTAAGWDEGTMVIGHNLGGVLGLRLLEQLAPKKIHSIVLVSTPFCAEVHVDALLHFFSHPIDWSKLRAAADNRIIIQSKNDKIIPYDHALRYQEFLDAALVLTTRDGHFTGKTCPRLIEAIQAWLPR